MSDKRFSQEFEIKLGREAKLYSKQDLSSNGHNFQITVIGSQRNLNFNIKNTGTDPVYLHSAVIKPSFTYPSKYGLRLDQDTSVDIREIYSWCKPDEVTIELKVSYRTITEKEESENKSVKVDLPFKEIAQMKTDTTFADATLVCDGVTIPCHRVILAARSEHFKNLFTKEGFVEGKTRRVEVRDMSVDTLREMLNFIYTDVADFDNESTDILALFMAAHLYSIPILMSRCGELLMEKLSSENAAEYFYKAYLTDNEDLKEACMEYIFNNCSKVLESNGWKELLKASNANQVVELLLRHMSYGQ